MQFDKFKILSIILGVLLALSLGYAIYNHFTSNNSVADQILIEQKNLRDEIVRSKTITVSRDDLEKYIKDLKIDLQVVRSDLADLNSELQSVTVNITKTPGFNGTNLPSTSSRPRPNTDSSIPEIFPCIDGSCINPDKFGYLNSSQTLKLSEPFNEKLSIPFGQTTFSAWKQQPWELKVFPREYRSVTILSVNEDGNHVAHNQFTVETEGKIYKLPIQNSSIVEIKSEPEFRFTPRFYLGLDAGAVIVNGSGVHGDLAPVIEVSLFSYGSARNDPVWSFVGIGAAYLIEEKRPAIVLNPVNYNVGRHIPLMTNLHVGPSVYLDTGLNFGIMGGLHVGL